VGKNPAVIDDSDTAELAEQVAQLQAELELLKSLNEVTRLINETDPLGGTLERICAVAAHSLAGCEVGMSLGGRARALESAASSTERSARLDDAQRDAGEGPCLLAMATQVQVRAAGDDLIRQWPVFGAAAVAEGVRAVVAEPFLVQGESRGALNIYVVEDRPLPDTELGLVQLLAAQAATALTNVQLYSQSAELARNLQLAMESRGVIEQAKGILMARRSCDEDTAFELLRRASQDHNVKVRDLARELVDWAISPSFQGAAPGLAPDHLGRLLGLHPQG
jgi:GAF domain-containing protein